MYLNSTLRRTLTIGGVSLLAVVGLIGWTRHEAAPASTAYDSSIGSAEPAIPAANQTAGYEYGASVSAPPAYRPSGGEVVYGSTPFTADDSSIYSHRANATPPPAPPEAVYATPAAPPAEYVSPAPVQQTVVERRYYYTRGGRRYVVVRRHRRPFSHSAAIVAGSAGAGAIIGGLAGGGKGAGIGALAGGAGGYVYDRLTRNK